MKGGGVAAVKGGVALDRPYIYILAYTADFGPLKLGRYSLNGANNFVCPIF